MGGAPPFLPSQRLPDFGYAAYGELLGLGGRKIEDPNQIEGAWRQALGADRPCVLEFVTDPSVPPMPPRTDLDQMQKVASSLLQGDPAAWQVVKEGVKAKAQEYLPGDSRHRLSKTVIPLGVRR